MKRLTIASLVASLALVGTVAGVATAQAQEPRPSGVTALETKTFGGPAKTPSQMEADGHVFKTATVSPELKTRGAIGGKVTKGFPDKTIEPAAKMSKSITALADPACVPNACYLYNGGKQDIGVDLGTTYRGVTSSVRVGGHTGKLHGATDYHSLEEVAVQGDNRGNIVEVGTTADYAVNGDYKETLFVFSWVNGVPTSYNLKSGSAFVPISGATYVPGVYEVTDGETLTFTILHDVTSTTSAWWIAVNGQWIGYYPDSQWTSATPSQTFTTTTFTQLFSEIASSEEKPCSDMGRGLIASDVNAQRFGDIRYYNAAGNPITAGVNMSTFRTPSATAGSPYANTYGEGPAGNQRAFRTGGVMWNDAGTGLGIRGHVGTSCG